MGKLVVRLGVVIAILLVAVVVAAIFLVPPLVESDEFGARVREGARAGLGVEVDYAGLSLRWIPFEIELDDLSIAVSGGDADAKPLLTTDQASLRMALLPLLFGRIVIHSLHADGAEVWLTRDGSGLRLPARPEGPAAPAASSNSKRAAHLIPRSIRLSNSRFVLEDRSGSRPVRWVLDGVEGRAHGSLLKLALELDLEGRLETGGEIGLSGNLGLDGAFSVELELRDVDALKLEIAQSLLEKSGLASFEGLVQGKLKVEGTSGGLQRIDAEIRVPEARLVRGELGVRGDLTLGCALGFSGSAAGDLFATLRLESGGTLKSAGKYADGGLSDLRLDLAEVSLAPMLGLVPDLQQLSGKLSGSLERPGRLDAPGSMRGVLQLRDALLVAEAFQLEGGVDVDVRLDPRILSASVRKATQAGTIEADLSEAELRYDPNYRKPAGTHATVSAQILAMPGGGLKLDITALRVRDFDATGAIEFDPGVRLSVLRLRSNVFDLRGWSELLLVLPEGVGGRAEIRDVAITFDPLRITGRVHLAGISTQRIELTGDIDLLGDRMVGDAMALDVGGQPLVTHLRIEDLNGDSTFEVRLATREPIDSNAFVSALLARPVSLSGPGEFEGVLAGSLGARSAADLTGSMKIRVGGSHGKGRLKELSWLALIMRAAGQTGRPAFPGMGGDEFDLLATTVQLSDGLLRSDDFRILYPSYTVKLRGTIGAADGSLDLKGNLLLRGRLLSSVLGPREAIDIPLAQVSGTFADPKVRVGPEAKDLLGGIFSARDVGSRAAKVVEGLLKQIP